MLCGTAVCEAHGLLLQEGPAAGHLYQSLDYQKLGCEKMDLPCFTSTDCPGGLNCCLMFRSTAAAAARSHAGSS